MKTFTLKHGNHSVVCNTIDVKKTGWIKISVRFFPAFKVMKRYIKCPVCNSTVILSSEEKYEQR